MRVSVETTTGLGRKAIVAVPSETFEAEVADRLKERAATLKLPGFRPGRVPMKEVRRRFDRSVRAEAAQTIVQSSLPDVLAKEELDVVGVPEVELLSTRSGNDFEYAATFEVRPTFALRPLEALRIRRPVAEIAAADVDETIELLREKRVEWVEVRRAARKKDRVAVDYAVKVDGEIRSEGADAELLAGGPFPVPELPQAVLGMAPGEARTFPATVPARPPAEDAEQPPSTDQGARSDGSGAAAAATPANAGEIAAAETPGPAGSATWDAAPPDAAAADDAGDADEGDGPDREEGIGEVRLKRVEEPHLPALDDSFFDRLGIEQGPDREQRFRTQVKGRMQSELDNAVSHAIRREMSDVLGGAHEFDLPVAMVRAEFAQRLQRIGDTVKVDSLPDWLQQAMVFQASNAVRLDLILGKVAEVADIALDQERLRTRIKELAANFEDEAEAERVLYGDQAQLERIAAAVLEDQVIEHVLARAEVVEVPCSYSEAIAGRGLPPLPEEDAEPAEGGPVAAGSPAPPPQTAPQPEAADAGAPAHGFVRRLRRLVGRDTPAESAQPAKESSR